ncbi:hypothetical protein TrVE_jg10125 [Triparma verrucosa]|uniref:Uncharacterized protein n=1 Tax=Triparma verrucosa TaxID=1606542 RepID=A0A9W7BTI7_9STRA|nr:hypothetical protein TrVE_jg10125 [Triparma verrucosa]
MATGCSICSTNNDYGVVCLAPTLGGGGFVEQSWADYMYDETLFLDGSLIDIYSWNLIQRGDHGTPDGGPELGIAILGPRGDNNYLGISYGCTECYSDATECVTKECEYSETSCTGFGCGQDRKCQDNIINMAPGSGFDELSTFWKFSEPWSAVKDGVPTSIVTGPRPGPEGGDVFISTYMCVGVQHVESEMSNCGNTCLMDEWEHEGVRQSFRITCDTWNF